MRFEINHDCASNGGSDGVTVVESAGSSGTKGGFVASGEDETRGSAVNPAIRLFVAAVVNASLCGSGVAALCVLAGAPLPDLPASTQGRQKPTAR